MSSTRFGIALVATLRGVVCAVLLGILVTQGAPAQEADWRAAFAAGEEARRAGDPAAYARAMADAVGALPPGHLNRPFVQYHAARAHALLGDAPAAARFLAMAWDEGIEALMISMAAYDPAFDAVRDGEDFRQVLRRPAGLELEVTRLAEGVHLLGGAGAQVLAVTTPRGAVLVDTGYRAALPAVGRALEALTGHDAPAGVILTHPHEDHWGALPDLAPGTPVWAHPGTLRALLEPFAFMEGVALPPKREAAAPSDVAVTDTTLVLSGVEVGIRSVPAHTGADVAVVLRRAGVVHLGDAYLGGNPMMFPGSEDPDGFLDRLDALLAGLPEGTVVVGGHDAPVGVEAVRNQVAESRACMALVRGALAEGLTVEETVARGEGRFPAPWVRFFHGALAAR